MNTRQNLNEPAIRQEILASIELKEAKLHHELLKQIFRLEIAERRSKKVFKLDEDYSENLYWCGFLLYHVGDREDVPLLWSAKQLDFDTACGFDIQALVGAGIETTINYLIENNHREIANYLQSCREQGDFNELSEWERFRYDYYYSK